jgi:dihydroorotase
LYDLLVKGGTLIDPARGIHEIMDIAISKTRVQEVAARIPEARAKHVIDAKGKFVTPGLVDLHTHVAFDVVKLAVDPETTCLARGATTAVDAGSTGELNFTAFKKYVIDQSHTRVLAFINIESLGMIEYDDISPTFTHQAWPELLTAATEIFAPMFVNVSATARIIRGNRRTIVGIKWAHHGLKMLELARKVADEAETRIMAENHYMPEALRYLKRGDIITHAYQFAVHRALHRYDGLTEDGKTIRPEIFEAVRRGIVLDVGHGQGSFSWRVGALALKEGLAPATISTDLWIGNAHGPVYDMPTTMSKFLHLGMDLDRVVEASTSRPAEVIGLKGEVGTLKPGASGDVAILALEEGRFKLTDSYGRTQLASRRLVPVQTVRGGKTILSPEIA